MAFKTFDGTGWFEIFEIVVKQTSKYVAVEASGWSKIREACVTTHPEEHERDRNEKAPPANRMITCSVSLRYDPFAQNSWFPSNDEPLILADPTTAIASPRLKARLERKVHSLTTAEPPSLIAPPISGKAGWRTVNAQDTKSNVFVPHTIILLLRPSEKKGVPL